MDKKKLLVTVELNEYDKHLVSDHVFNLSTGVYNVLKVNNYKKICTFYFYPNDGIDLPCVIRAETKQQALGFIKDKYPQFKVRLEDIRSYNKLGVIERSTTRG